MFSFCSEYALVFLYTPELFGTKARSLALSILVSIGNLVIGSSTFVILFMNWLEMHVMSLVWVFSICALVASLCLPETKDKGVPN